MTPTQTATVTLPVPLPEDLEDRIRVLARFSVDMERKFGSSAEETRRSIHDDFAKVFASIGITCLHEQERYMRIIDEEIAAPPPGWKPSVYSGGDC